MKLLKEPDSIYVRAAQGWLELGNHLEAEEELKKIPAKRRVHPQVLEVRWLICARKGQWETCLRLARILVRRVPERPSGWIDLAFSLHELKMTKEAWDNLLAVVDKFPSEPTIPYNLACYGAQLGRLWEAEQWLKQALNIGDRAALKRAALADSDLKPLWPKIKGL